MTVGATRATFGTTRAGPSSDVAPTLNSARSTSGHRVLYRQPSLMGQLEVDEQRAAAVRRRALLALVAIASLSAVSFSAALFFAYRSKRDVPERKVLRDAFGHDLVPNPSAKPYVIAG